MNDLGHVARRDLTTARALALFLGAFGLANLAGEIVAPGFDANLWWIDVRVLPVPLGQIVLLSGSALLVAFALHPALGKARRLATVAACTLLGVIAIANAANVLLLFARGAVQSAVPLPLSLIAAMVLGLVLRSVSNDAPARRSSWARSAVRMSLVLGCCAVGLPLALMLLFGNSDYRVPSDAVVVFGARAYADGRASDALADRVRTGAALVRDGWAHWLVLSGGPGDGAIHETESMRRLALRLGVDDERIVLDRRGVSTEATVAATGRIFRSLGVRRVLAVSHFYHLARVQLAYQHIGWHVRTVPAAQSYVLSSMPFLVAREVPALWYYWLRPVVPRSRRVHASGSFHSVPLRTVSS